MWGAIQLACTMILLMNCSESRQAINKNAEPTADSIVLFNRDSSLIAGNLPLVIQCQVQKNNAPTLKNQGKILLIFKNPTLLTAPEGVYEIYLTDKVPEVKTLSASQPSFVALLDLYSLTAPNPSRQFEVDISEHIRKLYLQKPSLNTVYLCTRFGPIKLADGTYSSSGGELRFSGISIVQLKN
jgi:hypothetical protein